MKRGNRALGASHARQLADGFEDARGYRQAPKTPLAAATRTRAGGIRPRLPAAVSGNCPRTTLLRFLWPGWQQFCRLGGVVYNFVGEIRAAL